MEGKLSDTKNKKILFAALVILLIIIIIMLIVMFRKPKYKITFDSNGGSEVSSVTVKKNEKIKKPDDPTKDGYIFAGWYYNDELYDFDKPVTKDMTLKAEWAVQGSATVKGIELNVTNLILGLNETATLEVTLIADDIEDDNLIWSSSDESIVKVDENGKVTALKEGTATITVKTADGKYTATCTITVTTEETVSVTGVTIKGATSVNVGSTIKLTATVTPSNATNKQVTWSSNNRSIATVDSNGNVRGIKAGSVTITATTVDGKISATYKVTVKEVATQPETPTQPETVSVTGVSISGANSVNVGSTITLTAAVAPSNATNKNVTWTSSDTSVATVDQSGNVRGVNDGTVTITVTTADGNKVATCTVTVKSVYAITITKNEQAVGVFDYSMAVYKNGSAFSGYTKVSYNGQFINKNQNVPVAGVNTSVTTAEILLSSGTKVTATVSYK